MYIESLERICKIVRIVFIFIIVGAIFLNKALSADACTPTGSSHANLGTYSSYSMINLYPLENSKLNSSGFRCNFGGLLKLLDSDWVSVTYLGADLNLVNQNDPAAKIPFSLYLDQNFETLLHPGIETKYKQGVLLSLLGLLGPNKVLDMPIYISVPVVDAGALTAGVYTATVGFSWSWNICRTIGLLGLCVGIPNKGKDVLSFLELNLIIHPDCKISARDINFGSQPFVTEFDEVKGVINIACTKGTAYKVGLSQGENYQQGYRQLKSGSDLIAYNIYKGRTKETWGDTESSKRSSSDADILPGVGLGSSAQGFNYTAEILPGQDAKPEGTYKDQIMIKVEF